MEQIRLSGQPPVQIILRRSPRARRLSLRVSRLDGRVTMTLPKRTPLREAKGFATEKADWIRQALTERPTPERPQIGQTILFEGHQVPILAGPGRIARYHDGAIRVPDTPERVAPRLAAFFKLSARQRLTQASERYAAALGKPFGKIAIRDTRSRWGSCSSQGNLMYSWRLIMAPPAVLDYVAAHEAAHLVEMNHSPDYWAVVSQIYPDYQNQRAWLRENGAILHRYRFSD
ncbi:MAG: zinc metalloprotease [Rhodobacterales bacterium]|nr:MAG: zinc metalloprotease [Rhodobacterales bacterium]